MGDLIIGYKFRQDDVWHAYGVQCLGYVSSVKHDADDVGYVYDVCWLEAGTQKSSIPYLGNMRDKWKTSGVW